MNTDLMFSSATDLWSTPQEFFDKLNEEFHFTTDVCATKENTKCPYYYTKEEDGLKMPWAHPGSACWMNPPYGRGIGAWVKKAWETSIAGTLVVCLLPARTDTAWWHDYCMNGEIRFIRGRLKFGGQKNSAPFPSAVVVFHAVSAACTCWSDYLDRGCPIHGEVQNTFDCPEVATCFELIRDGKVTPEDIRLLQVALTSAKAGE